MTAAIPDFETEIEATRAHTASYATDPEFRTQWLGFTRQSRNYRSQLLRAFGELVGSLTATLSGWRILDVGCGDGRWLRTFLEFDAKPEDLVGIDVSDARFEIGRAKNPLITLMRTDGTTIPFEDGYFDLVTQFVCFSNIPTVALRNRVADEIRRVVKPGGFVFWWDLPYTTAPYDRNANLQPSDYLEWPIRELAVGELPRPSECLRSLRGVRRLLGPVLDRLAYPPTHIAALIGPKP
ncbi:MAG: class I SAM-dependent methyltransferase [Chloroflexi bacterium]|nr:class I SAM-dependent methyltransferase [Chloroflexota bacterium]